MNAPLRRVGVVVLVLFGLLFANLNWVQAYKADEYRTSDYNGRVQIAEYERRARQVIEAGGSALAQSMPTDGELKYLRHLPARRAVRARRRLQAGQPRRPPASSSCENDFLAGNADSLVADRICRHVHRRADAGRQRAAEPLQARRRRRRSRS